MITYNFPPHTLYSTIVLYGDHFLSLRTSHLLRDSVDIFLIVHPSNNDSPLVNELPHTFPFSFPILR